MNRRNTIQGALVLETVRRLQCHATADEVYAEVAREHPHISRATVYRNLNRLAERGEIRKLEVPGGADRFDHRCHDHCHVRCERCGRVFDVDMDYVPGLEQRIRDAHGFVFSGYDILFRGICPECREKADACGREPADDT